MGSISHHRPEFHASPGILKVNTYVFPVVNENPEAYDLAELFMKTPLGGRVNT